MPVIPVAPTAPVVVSPQSFFRVQKMTPKFMQNVGQASSPFTFSSQYFDWQAQLLSYSVALAPMTRADADARVAALLQGRITPLTFGPVGVRRFPKGDAALLPANLLTATEDFTSSVWGRDIGVTVVANAATDPNGGSTADVVSYDGSDGAGNYRIFQGTQRSVPAGLTLTTSIYLRVTAGAISLRLGDNSGAPPTDITVTTAWQRFSISQPTSGSNPQLVIYSAVGSTGPFSVSAWGAQMEFGAVATPYQTPPYVSVAALAGASTLSTKWPLLSRTVLKAMDYIQIGSYLYAVLTDVVTDASGNATITLFNRLRADVALNTSIVSQYPQGLFRVMGNTLQYDESPGGIVALGFDVVEAI